MATLKARVLTLEQARPAADDLLQTDARMLALTERLEQSIEAGRLAGIVETPEEQAIGQRALMDEVRRLRGME